MNDIERCAQLMGMKPSEVVEVVLDADGVLVQTHDGQWTLIRDDGTLQPGAAPEPAVERDADVVDPDPAKPAPKRRGRS